MQLKLVTLQNDLNNFHFESLSKNYIMSNLKAKNANAISRNTVFGFVRSHEQAESMNTPEIIKCLILNYYLLVDKFKEHDQWIKLTEGNTIAALTNAGAPEEALVFGATNICCDDDGVVEYEWAIQLMTVNTLKLEIGLCPPSSIRPLRSFGMRFFATSS